MVEQLWQDFRFALRLLRRNPGFTLTAALTLALGIGANTAIFTVVNAVLLQPLPFPEPDRLVQIWESRPDRGVFRNYVNALNFLDWHDRTHSFEGMAAVQSGLIANLTGLGNPVGINGGEVSPQYFSILGVFPALGRAFTAEEGLPGKEHVTILSYGLWQERFGADRAILGRTIALNGEPHVVVGVMPRGFTLPKFTPELWRPLPTVRSKAFESGRWLEVIARLKRGVTLTQAQEDLRAVTRQLEVERPKMEQHWSAEAVPMLANATEKVRLPLLVLLAAVGLVLLIACANVANLLLIRASGRMREIAVRAALGAGQRRLLQQLLSESLVLSLVACAAGLLAARWGVKALVAMIPRQSQLPRADAIHMDASVFLFALGLSIVTAAIFGLIPSMQVSQLAPQAMLQQGAVRTASGSRSLLRQSLVVAEIAFSLLLLIGAGLMLRSFQRLISVNPGFETQRILTVSLFTSPAKYLDTQKRATHYARMLEEIGAVPGVRAAGSTHFLPLQGRTSGSGWWRAGEPPPDQTTARGAEFLVVSPGYFEVMGTPLLSGRHFDDRDRPNGAGVIMVNQEFVRHFLSDRNPIGQKLNVDWSFIQNPAEIVGVVADARQSSLGEAPQPIIFLDNLQAPMFFAQLVVRAFGDPRQIERAVEAAIHRVDPDQPVTHVETMDQVFSESVAQPRLQMALLLTFGAIAGLLAMIGVYGVVAYSVAQRTREIGIRVALGALPKDVSRLVLREGATLGAIGIGIGLGGALALTRILRTLLFQITPTDPATLAFVSAGVLLVVMVATILPAWRAARVDPTVALRYE